MSLGVRFGSIICSMVINMNEQKLNTVAQLRAFLEGTEAVRFDVLGEDDKRRYVFIAEVVNRPSAGQTLCRAQGRLPA